MSWERKPSYSNLTFDGVFSSWDEALKCAFENILNDDTDPEEIKNATDPPPKTFIDLVPSTKEDIISIFPGISFSKYDYNEFTEFWFEHKCYHIKKIN